ncbi:putative trancriptional regulator, ArsR family [Halapricum desulfuricans]|uniref:Putative trancriptional regulator, ArsR family n=1 Tax=Halapricum desulfuricans TaxID=2841257 RepID=A0A897NDY9_9EURY|nr:hypothetical protein [Halapricum desulfuricans]QSG10748.1 putative trancriptional regulator, ArsR family [Halapricum desulfuricans]
MGSKTEAVTASTDGQAVAGVGPDDGTRGKDERNGSPEAELSRDDAFEILSNRRRRFALHHLQHNGERAELGELSEHVAAWENDSGVQEISASERKRVYTSLQQFHLPKMDDKGVVEFDDREGVVELTAAAEQMDVYLEVVEGNDVPWSQYYLGLAAVNLGLLVAATAGTYPLRLVPDAGWGLFVATTFLVSALVHTYYSRTEMRLGDSESPPEVRE